MPGSQHTTRNETPAPDGLLRRRVTLEDGRYLLYYTDGDDRPPPPSEQASKPEAAAAPAPVDAQPIADEKAGGKQQTEEPRV